MDPCIKTRGVGLSHSFEPDVANLLQRTHAFERLLRNAALKQTVFPNVVREGLQFYDQAWHSLKNRDSKLEVVEAISIEGNEDKRLGNVVLFATDNYQNKGPRFDCVIISFHDGTQPAQLLTLLKLTCCHTNSTQFFGVVRLLKLIKLI